MKSRYHKIECVDGSFDYIPIDISRSEDYIKSVNRVIGDWKANKRLGDFMLGVLLFMWSVLFFVLVANLMK